MNITFALAACPYGGTLLNNRGICSGVDSMHVLYRSLAHPIPQETPCSMRWRG